MMKTQKVAEHILQWLKTYSDNSRTNGFVIGISGGIDSAVTSTLCALTGKKVIALNMPIRQTKPEYDRGWEHIKWLKQNYPNVIGEELDLSPTFEKIESTFPTEIQDFLTMANTRARLRMLTLYTYAGHHKLLVAGTGNKVEDFGVGFYTKYGDGGVDISPIADLMKSEVYEIAKYLGVVGSIQSAKPTDGLWADGRSDEDQLGASYDELEWAMLAIENKMDTSIFTTRQKEVHDLFLKLNRVNKHKMDSIPVCMIPKEFK
jgi:NAD+ synthase